MESVALWHCFAALSVALLGTTIGGQIDTYNHANGQYSPIWWKWARISNVIGGAGLLALMPTFFMFGIYAVVHIPR